MYNDLPCNRGRSVASVKSISVEADGIPVPDTVVIYKVQARRAARSPDGMTIVNFLLRDVPERELLKQRAYLYRVLGQYYLEVEETLEPDGANAREATMCAGAW
jgi:hypothetical protein